MVAASAVSSTAFLGLELLFPSERSFYNNPHGVGHLALSDLCLLPSTLSTQTELPPIAEPGVADAWYFWVGFLHPGYLLRQET